MKRIVTKAATRLTHTSLFGGIRTILEVFPSLFTPIHSKMGGFDTSSVYNTSVLLLDDDADDCSSERQNSKVHRLANHPVEE
jgi:hypothetical protein